MHSSLHPRKPQTLNFALQQFYEQINRTSLNLHINSVYLMVYYRTKHLALCQTSSLVQRRNDCYFSEIVVSSEFLESCDVCLKERFQTITFYSFQVEII